MGLPSVIYIYEDGEGDDKYLVATTEASDKVEGVVGVYDFRETLHVRHVAEFRRSKTKQWFR